MTVQELSIRKVTLDTLPAVHALVERCFRSKDAAKGWCSEAEFFTGARITPAGMLDKFQHPDTVFLAGYDRDPSSENKETLVTCCEIARRDPDTCYFGLFAVDPALQGGGVGSRVLREAERYAREELGCARMEMQVIDRRDTLIAYYVRRGYARTEEKRPFPYELFGEGTILRDDLQFAVLVKELTA
ncbi:Acyl-CoA N-acyltransferase [Cordyceps fumosorosea ARSEF 2679]|uniref:Acyl-CoA N-acyltransferase n=1 Tax=Cordyceps fumosorosea (strain ARSEF 2679) TaxID=1081104 RepID=A0A167S9Q6_CORFA|nr:Acyl-CoA N-acyltransferase [Cordyceps fumosorosea ARSEF 2679]OAA59403.1 Acyl-CoA N-acyltransferase [Cordyceps fumosorosea ARSEF 2679]